MAFENELIWETAEDGTVSGFLENGNGVFFADGEGMLTGFWPVQKNRLGSFGGKYAVKRIEIPEGVRAIGRTADVSAQEEQSEDCISFRGSIVAEEVRFPATLRRLGSGVFSNSMIMDIELPAGLREIGAGAFRNSYIHQLRVPRGMREPVTADSRQPAETAEPHGVDSRQPAEQDERGRLLVYEQQFMETVIETLHVPEDCPKSVFELLLREARIGKTVFY